MDEIIVSEPPDAVSDSIKSTVASVNAPSGDRKEKVADDQYCDDPLPEATIMDEPVIKDESLVAVASFDTNAGIATAAALKARAKNKTKKKERVAPSADTAAHDGREQCPAVDTGHNNSTNDNSDQVPPGAYRMSTTSPRQERQQYDNNDRPTDDGHQSSSLMALPSMEAELDAHRSTTSFLTIPPLEAELVDPTITAIPFGDNHGDSRESKYALSTDVSKLQQEVTECSHVNRRLLIILTSVISVIVVVVIVIVVVWYQLINRRSDTGTDIAATANTTANAALTQQEIIDAIQAKTNNTTVFYLGSPAQEALTWIFRDPFAQILMENRNLSQILQRYALALFYFGTNGFNWRRNVNWVTATDECLNWVGVACSGNVVSTLALQDNLLDGQIPSQVLLLLQDSLVKLDLARNNLHGTIPSVSTQLTKLVDLRLFDNRLAGSLPSNLGTLTRLRHLAIGLNRLTGRLPTTLSRLTALTFLSVRDNDGLSGSIPSGLANLKVLRELYFSNSNLVGSLPMELCDMLQVGWIDCANIACNCCTTNLGEPCPITQTSSPSLSSSLSSPFIAESRLLFPTVSPLSPQPSSN